MYKYRVVTLRTPEFQSSVIDKHYAFLDRLHAAGKLEVAGPFTDKTGGAYLLKANDLEESKMLAHQDPVHTTGSSKVTVYEWNAK